MNWLQKIAAHCPKCGTEMFGDDCMTCDYKKPNPNNFTPQTPEGQRNQFSIERMMDSDEQFDPNFQQMMKNLTKYLAKDNPQAQEILDELTLRMRFDVITRIQMSRLFGDDIVIAFQNAGQDYDEFIQRILAQ